MFSLLFSHNDPVTKYQALVQIACCSRSCCCCGTNNRFTIPRLL